MWRLFRVIQFCDFPISARDLVLMVCVSVRVRHFSDKKRAKRHRSIYREMRGVDGGDMRDIVWSGKFLAKGRTDWFGAG